MAEPIPVNVITGALGAGKTTLVNRILGGGHGLRIAVIVNEFGEVGIDGDLIEGASEELVEFSDGCVCCTIRGDLVRTLRALLERPGRFDQIVLETSGLAVPGPVVQTFLVDQTLASLTAIDTVTAIVDAHHVMNQLVDCPEVAEQIAFADRVLLNKSELANAAELGVIEARLKQINPLALIHRASRVDVALDDLVRCGGFDLQRIGLLDEAAGMKTDGAPGHIHNDECGHEHTGGIASVSLRSDQPMDSERIKDWLERLVATRGADILRGKGIIALAGEDRRFVFHSVHMLIEGDLQRPWRAGEARTSRIVFIGRNLDPAELEAAFEDCVQKPSDNRTPVSRRDEAAPRSNRARHWQD